MDTEKKLKRDEKWKAVKPAIWCRLSPLSLHVLALFFVASAFATIKPVTLSWVDQSNNEDGFFIERSVSGSEFVALGDTEENVSTYTDRNVNAGEEYRYRVCAFNAYGRSGYSEIASIVVSENSENIVGIGLIENSLIGEMDAIGSCEYVADAEGYSFTASGMGYEKYLDELRYAYVRLEGDFTIRVHVPVFEPDGYGARIGLMARESLAQDSRHDSVVLSGEGSIQRLSRLTKGGTVSVTRQVFSRSGVYLGLERRNGFIYSSYSLDGKSWIDCTGDPFQMPGQILVGMAIGSQDDGQVSSGFVQVLNTDIIAFGDPERVLFESLNRSIDSVIIGDMDKEGSYVFAGDTHTHIMTASGMGYEAFLDELRFSRIDMNGDFNLKVRLIDFVPDGGGSRAGLMIRNDMGQDSTHFSVLVDGNGNFEMLYRQANGSTVIRKVYGAAPPAAYLSLEKEGALLRGYCSSDGQNWNLLMENSIELEKNFQLGLAIGSYKDGQISKAKFQILESTTNKLEGAASSRSESSDKFKILGIESETNVIGEMYLEGSPSYDSVSDLYLIEASGLGFEYYEDELRYTSVPAGEEFSLIVRLHDYRPDLGGSRVGVMLRSSFDPKAKFVAIVISGSGDFQSLWRTNSGGRLVAERGEQFGNTPFLKLQRKKNEIQLSVSSDGTTWVKMKDLSWTPASTDRIGFVIGSEADGSLSSCIIETIR